MKLTLEAEPGELEEKSLSMVRCVASRLAKYDPRLVIVAKALWKADLASRGEVNYQGLCIVIENPVGSIRHWKDHKNGNEGSTVMKHPYGYIKGTKGADGDSYDCFLGPNPDAPCVWIVHQARPDLGDTQQDARAIYDEDKALLGFVDVHEAAAAYQSHYDDNSFFGSMTQMTIEEFKAKVLATHGPTQDGMLKSEPSPSADGEREAQDVKVRRPEGTRFVLADMTLSKGLAPQFAGGASPGLGDRAVVTGSGGPNIAMGVPPRPNHAADALSPTSLRSALEASVVDRDKDRESAPRRDPAVYSSSSLTELPLHPLPEWEQRMVTGQEARKDMPANLQYVQDKLDRRSAFIREGHPERLLPRDPRDQQRFFIPEAKAEVERQERAIKAEAPLPDDAPFARLEPEAPAKPEYKLPRSTPTPASPAADVALPANLLRSATVEKAELGPVTLNVRADPAFLEPRFEVLVRGRVPRAFASLSAACDHVWVLSKGYKDVRDWRAQTGLRKVPSGAGWRFWNIDPASVTEVRS